MKKSGAILFGGIFLISFILLINQAQSQSSTKFFKAPKATIVTDPNFVPRGTWGGESDGKTIGSDGKPLGDHQIYANDSYYFLEFLTGGMAKLISEADRSQIDEIVLIMSAQDKAKRDKRIKMYEARWRKSLTKEKYYELAKLIARLKSAKFKYDAAEGYINYKEQIRLKDRIDLNQAPNPDGEKNRLQIKKAIAEMYKARKTILKKYPKIYAAGKQIQMSKMKAKIASMKFAVIKNDKAQMFIYQSFKRTPMLKGLAWANEGKVLEGAKQIFLAKGEKVQILKSKTVPGSFEGKKTNLKVNQIKIKSGKMAQHDGKALPEMTLTGWVLSKELVPSK